MRRVLDTLNVLLAATTVGFAVWVWPRLPDRIPVHFGADGQPDRWSDTTVFSWFLLPAIGLATWGFITLARQWVVRRPEKMNLPSGGTLADYPVEVRPAVVEHMKAFMSLVSLEVLVIFGLIVFGSYRTAMGNDGQGIMLAVLAIAVLSGPVLMVTFLVGMQRITRAHSARPGSRRST